MTRMVDGKNEISVAELMPIVDAIYEDNYTLHRYPGREKPSDEVIKKTMDAVKEFRKELEVVLSAARDGKMILLSAQERQQKMEELKQKGLKFNELHIENSGEPESDED